MKWPKKHTSWIEDQVIFYSIPFTWNLPEVRHEIQQKKIYWDRVVVGGPAVNLMPDYFDDIPWVHVGDNYPGILQMINPGSFTVDEGKGGSFENLCCKQLAKSDPA